MRQLKKKSGFTLVECLIAIAVFAIMSLLVLTIISASVKRNNENSRTTSNLMTQTAALASGASFITSSPTSGMIVMSVTYIQGSITLSNGSWNASFNDSATIFTFPVRTITTNESAINASNILEITDFEHVSAFP